MSSDNSDGGQNDTRAKRRKLNNVSKTTDDSEGLQQASCKFQTMSSSNIRAIQYASFDNVDMQEYDNHLLK
jgi:hypothetical protein